MMSEINDHGFSEKINVKIHEYTGSSSSSDSENERSSFKSKAKKRLFGRKKSVHAVLGGGKSVDIILWRNKQLSGSIVAGATVIWLLFEWIGYHLLTFICHFLILLLAVSFIWSNAASFVNRSPPKFPEIMLSEEMMLCIAHAISYRINEAFATFKFVASGKDVKTFLQVIGGLWMISVVGSWFSFWTLVYLVFLMLHTAPVLYEKYEDHVDTAAEKAMVVEKYEDHVDTAAEKAMVELNKHYAVFNAKVLQKIPRGPFSDKKQN